MSSASHVHFNIARQRGHLSPEPSTGPRLTASNYEIYHFSSCEKSFLHEISALLNNRHAVHAGSFLYT